MIINVARRFDRLLYLLNSRFRVPDPRPVFNATIITGHLLGTRHTGMSLQINWISANQTANFEVTNRGRHMIKLATAGHVELRIK